MNLLFYANPKDLGELVCCLKSVELHGGYEHYEVYLLNRSLDDITFRALCTDFGKHMTFHFVKFSDELFENIPPTDQHYWKIYYRLIALHCLPDEMERILYLDVGTVVINSLKPLYEMDFEENYLVGCSHPKRFPTNNHRSRLHIGKVSDNADTGFLLLNLLALRKHFSFQEMKQYVHDNEKNHILTDQKNLAVLFGDKIKLVDTMRYNLSDRVLHQYNAVHWHRKIDIDWVRRNTVIIHYCRTNKPWNEDYVGKLGIFYQELLLESYRLDNR